MENMRENLEVLKYSTLAPSRYLVYLHASEFARLEGIVPILQEQAVRALSEELETLNRRLVLHRYADRLLRRRPSARPERGNGLAGRVPPGSRRRGSSRGTSWSRRSCCCPQAPSLAWANAPGGSRPSTSDSASPRESRSSAGSRRHRWPAFLPESRTRTTPATTLTTCVKDSVTVGRGGIAYPVDVRIVSSVDVSREHTRIRRDPKTGRFFLIDLSSLGTTVNGRPVPRGYDDVEGTKRENGTEAPLPERARIGLADTVYLDFQAVT